MLFTWRFVTMCSLSLSSLAICINELPKVPPCHTQLPCQPQDIVHFFLRRWLSLRPPEFSPTIWVFRENTQFSPKLCGCGFGSPSLSLSKAKHDSGMVLWLWISCLWEQVQGDGGLVQGAGDRLHSCCGRVTWWVAQGGPRAASQAELSLSPGETHGAGGEWQIWPSGQEGLYSAAEGACKHAAKPQPWPPWCRDWRPFVKT